MDHSKQLDGRNRGARKCGLNFHRTSFGGQKLLYVDKVDENIPSRVVTVDSVAGILIFWVEGTSMQFG